MAQVSKMSSDVLYYWHHMQNYRDAASEVGRRYILEVEMHTFLTQAENPRVIKLLSEFLKSKGVSVDDQ